MTTTREQKAQALNWAPQWQWALGNKYGYRQYLAERSKELEQLHFDTFKLERLNSVFGAQITGLDLNRPLSDKTIDELIKAICHYHVIVFRDQKLSQDALFDFGTSLGELNLNPLRNYAKDQKQVDLVLHDENRDSVENVWHIDETWRELPPWLTFIQLRDCPRGGDTLFSSLESVYQGLDDEFKALLDNVYCEYDHRCWLKEPMARHCDVNEIMTKFPPIQHPIVTEHPVTGNKQLYFSPTFLSKLTGLPEGVSQDEVIMRLLWEVSIPEFQCRINWHEGDLGIFDNYSNIHYATFDYWPNTRSIDRMGVMLPAEHRHRVLQQVRRPDFSVTA